MRLAPPRPLRRHGRRRPRRPEGPPLPDRPHRLLRRLRHHDGARRGRARADRCRRGHRARRGCDARRSRPTRRLRRCERPSARPRPRADRRGGRRPAPRALRRRRRLGRATSRRSIGSYDAIVIRSATKLTADLIERADRLKVIGRAGVGVDNVDVDAATRRGIVVANAPDVDGRLGGGADDRAARRARAQHPAGARGAEAGQLGALALGRRSSSRARRSACSASAGSASRSRGARSGSGMRVVAYDPFVGDDRFREARRRARSRRSTTCSRRRRLRHAAPAADRRDDAGSSTRTRSRRCGTARASSTPRAARSSTRTRSSRRSGRASSRRAALDVFSAEPYTGPLLELDERGRHAAPRRLDRRGAGSRGRDHRRAGRRRPRGRARHERGQHPGRRRRRTSRCSGRSSRSRRSSAGSRSSSPAAGRSRSPSPRTAPLSEYDTRLLTVAALNGVFQGRVDQAVNYVNAPLIAAERGIEVAEERLRASRDYMNVVEVRRRRRRRQRGTTIGPEPRLFLASALGFAIDIELAPNLVFLLYDRHAGRDRPGRDDVRRARREHREHGGLADARGRQGADGASRSTRPRRRSSSSSSTQRASTTPGSSARLERPSPKRTTVRRPMELVATLG